MLCNTAWPTHFSNSQTSQQLDQACYGRSPAPRPSRAVCTCGLKGRSLETSVSKSAGRSLIVQLRSSGNAVASGAADVQTQASSAASQVASEVQQAGNVEGAMLEPSVAKKDWVRVLAISTAVLALARLAPSYLPAKNVAFLHLLAYSTFVGTNLWTTFIAGLTMFKNLPRQMFGKLQSKLFPKYFALLSAACVICMGTITFSPGASLPKSQTIALGVGLATTVLNWLYVEPMNTKSMNERYVLENAQGPKDEARIKQMKKEFGKWHGASISLNVAGLCGVMAHGWWLSSKIAFVPA